MRIGSKKIKAVVSDFDGTIVKGLAQRPSEAFFEMLDELQRQGVFFVAASGRQYPNLRALFNRLGREIAYICENGCLVMYKGEVLYKAAIEEDIAEPLIRELLTIPDAGLLVAGQECGYILPDDPEHADFLERQMGNVIRKVSDFSQVKEPKLKISIHFPKGIPADVERRLHEKYDDCLQLADAGNQWLDFNPKGSGKGPALRVLAEKLGIRLSETIAFGDSENDISMLQEAGLSFAMDTAREQVKRAARYVCEDVAEVLRYAMDQDVRVEQMVRQLGQSAGRSPQETDELWQALDGEEDILEEFLYYVQHGTFQGKLCIGEYSAVDILIWQMDHFRAHMDRTSGANRYQPDHLLFDTLMTLVRMKQNPQPYIEKLRSETGTDL